MIPIVIGNIIALIASILMVLAGLQKKKKKILFIQIIQIGLSIISNIVLGGYTGAIINALSCVRDILCYKDKMGTKEKIIIIILAIGLSLAFNNLGWIGLLPLVATITYISFMDTKNVVKFKMLIIFSMIMWLAYDLYIKSYTSAVFDFLSIVANIIAILQIKFGKDKDAILFDLDGTLWEVTDATYNSVNEVAKNHNLQEVTKETIEGVFGLNRIEAAKKYFPYLETEESIKLLDEISTVNIKNLKEHGGNVYQNVEEVLRELKKNYKLFIVSNTGHSEYIEAFLSTSNLKKYFKDYVAASELNMSKADAIKKVINDYNIKNYVYIGDTQKDLEATKVADVPFIQAKYGFGEDLKTDFYIDSIEELPSTVQKVFKSI